MDNTFTAEDMKDYGDYVATLDSAMLSPNFEKWCKERFEPAKKVIDLSVLIESGIDCEIGDGNDFWLVRVSSLLLVTEDTNFICDLGVQWKYCRPRMNHIHSWQGGECPLPEGFEVQLWDRYGRDAVRTIASGNGLEWHDFNLSSDIIAFEVLGVADGYVMPWEQDNAK